MKIKDYIFESLLLLILLGITTFLYWEIIVIYSNYLYYVVPILITIAIFVVQLQHRKIDNESTSVTFIENEGTFLFTPIAYSIKKLKVKYSKSELDKKLIFYQATILNSGQKDIDSSVFHKPLTLKLKNGYTWKSVDITFQSEDIDLKYKLVNDTIYFEWDLLKKNEYFKFDSLIEFEQDYSNSKASEILRGIFKNISFSCSRIKNMKLKRTNFAKGESILFFSRLFIFPAFILVFAFCNNYINQNQLVYKFSNGKDTLGIKHSVDFSNKIVLENSLDKEISLETIKKTELKLIDCYYIDKHNKNERLFLFFKIFIWFPMIYLILLILKKRYYLKRKEIDDFLAYPYRKKYDISIEKRIYNE